MLQVDGVEEVLVGEEHLRLAEEEKSAGVEREVKVGQDAALGLGVEVDQGVAAHEEVHAGDRRVVGQVVAAEDDRASQVATERVAVPRPLEVPPPEIIGDRFELLDIVGRLPALGEGVVVHVGRVDLDPLAERLGPEALGPHHGQRERLLSGGAAAAPDPDGLAVALGGEDRRDDLSAERLPGLGIAEEGGDIDQDGVEELGELLGVDLQVVMVVGERAEVHLLGPLADPPQERGPLVPGEIYRSTLPEIVQQGLGALGLSVAVTHRRSAPDPSPGSPGPGEFPRSEARSRPCPSRSRRPACRRSPRSSRPAR